MRKWIKMGITGAGGIALAMGAVAAVAQQGAPAAPAGDAVDPHDHAQLDPPLPGGSAEGLEERMRQRRAQFGAGFQEGTPPFDKDNPGPSSGFGARSARPPEPTVPEPSIAQRRGPTILRPPAWDSQPGWSKEDHGLRVQLFGSRYITPTVGLHANLMFWNDDEKERAFCLSDPACYAWEMRDAENKVVPVEKSTAVGVNPEWYMQGRGYLPLFDKSSEPASEQGRPNVVRAGAVQWTLAPGEYTLHGVFSGPSKAPGRRKDVDVPVWEGNVELAPFSIVVYGEVKPEEIARAAAAIRQKEWKDKGDMYRALAKLIQPGMTEKDVEAILPRGQGEASAWAGMGVSSGAAVRENYALDGDYGVEIGGTMDAGGGRGIARLSAPPQIFSKQEFEAEHQARGRGR